MEARKRLDSVVEASRLGQADTTSGELAFGIVSKRRKFSPELYLVLVESMVDLPAAAQVFVIRLEQVIRPDVGHRQARIEEVVEPGPSSDGGVRGRRQAAAGPIRPGEATESRQGAGTGRTRQSAETAAYAASRGRGESKTFATSGRGGGRGSFSSTIAGDPLPGPGLLTPPTRASGRPSPSASITTPESRAPKCQYSPTSLPSVASSRLSWHGKKVFDALTSRRGWPSIESGPSTHQIE